MFSFAQLIVVGTCSTLSNYTDWSNLQCYTFQIYYQNSYTGWPSLQLSTKYISYDATLNPSN